MARKKAEADKRNSFTFYASWEEAISEIEEIDEHTQLVLYRAICRYALYKEEPRFKGLLNVAWLAIQAVIDKQWVLYRNSLNKDKDTKEQPKDKQSATKEQPKDNQSATNPLFCIDIGIDKGIDKGTDCVSVCNNGTRTDTKNLVLEFISKNCLNIKDEMILPTDEQCKYIMAHYPERAWKKILADMNNDEHCQPFRNGRKRNCYQVFVKWADARTANGSLYSQNSDQPARTTSKLTPEEQQRAQQLREARERLIRERDAK